jgi:nitrate reductase NapE component
LLIIEGLHRLALVYVLTQTFCPNLILYYSITNLMVFILSQVEAQSRYGLNKSLYVKHDIYRFLFLSLLFFAITSITQISSYGFKTLIVFILALKWHINALQNYDESKFT